MTNLPVLLVPPWAKTKCQPIGVRDVIKYLVGVLEIDATTGKSYDIGGGDVLTYKEMMKTLARLLDESDFLSPARSATSRCSPTSRVSSRPCPLRSPGA